MDTIEAHVTINSNRDAFHLGRYAVQLFRNGRPGALKVTDSPAELVAQLTAKGLDMGLLVEFVDNTGE